MRTTRRVKPRLQLALDRDQADELIAWLAAAAGTYPRGKAREPVLLFRQRVEYGRARVWGIPDAGPED
jgi:hypothetical protein